MMTKKEFYKDKEAKAYKIAVEAVQDRSAELGIPRTSDVIWEQELILWEWWDDYRHESV